MCISLCVCVCVCCLCVRVCVCVHMRANFSIFFCCYLSMHLHTYIHPFNGPFSRTTQMSRYQKGKTNQDFTETRDSEWQWHQLGHMQVCTSLQTDNHASTPPHHSVFHRPGAFPAVQPTASKHLMHLLWDFFLGGLLVIAWWCSVPVKKVVQKAHT